MAMFQHILLMIIIHLFLTCLILAFCGLLHGYTTITSNFGYRKSPITGAISYHSGIDIGAPTGSNIIAIYGGKVSFIGFSGAGGYTVIVKNGQFTFSYCHVSPVFLVNVGQLINKGDLIAKVGPKNVYGVYNNPYKDNYGNPTNRCYNWSPFASYNKRRWQSHQSLKLFLIYMSSSSYL
ncbi:MAG: M23 family metallopeptidase [Clostridia bacterium]|nr:M23 family metallopeptidase [Clostridia bacterium]